MPEFDWRSPESTMSRARCRHHRHSPGNASSQCRLPARLSRDASPADLDGEVTPEFQEEVGHLLFAADPQGSFGEQTIFWAPEVLPTVIPVAAITRRLAFATSVCLCDLAAGELRQAPDGWHAVFASARRRASRLAEGAAGRSLPPMRSNLPFDGDFECRAHAARRLWRAMNGRTSRARIS